MINVGGSTSERDEELPRRERYRRRLLSKTDLTPNGGGPFVDETASNRYVDRLAVPFKIGFARGPAGERASKSRCGNQREDGEAENCRKFGDGDHFVVNRGGIRMVELVLGVPRTRMQTFYTLILVSAYLSWQSYAYFLKLFTF